MLGQSRQAVDVCIADLKLRLKAAGFQVSVGSAVDRPTWIALAEVAGSDNANRVGGVGQWEKNLAMQLAACGAIKQTLGTLAPAIIAERVVNQNKRLVADERYVEPVFRKPVPKRMFALLGLGVATAAVGFIMMPRN
jgi:hypothetical protein